MAIRGKLISNFAVAMLWQCCGNLKTRKNLDFTPLLQSGKQNEVELDRSKK
jgi:hypothetical protein